MEYAPIMDEKIVEALTYASTATVSMQLLKRGFRSVAMRGVKPLGTATRRTVGRAYTLRYIPMREDLCAPEVLARSDFAPRVAIEEVPAGSILVIAALGHADTGVVGDILAARLKHRGLAAIVTDGGVRDAAAVSDVGLPIWCAGPAAPASITTLAGADLQTPVGCGGVAVIPGDVLVCDGDGVVVVPQQIVGEVAESARSQEHLETFVQMRIAEGSTTRGVYPPDEKTLAAYEAWVRSGEAG